MPGKPNELELMMQTVEELDAYNPSKKEEANAMIHALHGIVEFVDTVNKTGVDIPESIEGESIEKVLEDARKVLDVLIQCRDGVLPNDTFVKH